MKKTILVTTTKCLALMVLMLVTMITGAKAETITQTVTFDSSVWGTAAQTLQGGESWTNRGVTLSVTPSSYDLYITSQGALEVWYDGTVQITAQAGITLTNAVITGSGDELSASEGTLTPVASATSSGYSWAGSTSSLTLIPGSGDRDLYRFDSIELTYEIDLDNLASTANSEAQYNFTSADAFVGTSLHAKTISAGAQEMYLDGFQASDDPVIQQNMTAGGTYLHMQAGSRLWLKRSDSNSNVSITKAVFTFASGSPSISPDGGTYDSSTNTWTGREEQLIFTFNDDADIRMVESEAATLYKVDISTYGRGTTKYGDETITRGSADNNYNGNATVYLKADESLTLTFTPDNRRYVSSAERRDGFTNTTDITTEVATGSYTVSGLTDDCMVLVYYDLMYPMIDYSVAGNGTIQLSATYLDDKDEESSYIGEEVSNDTKQVGIAYGGTLTFTMTPGSGYKLGTFMVNGQDRIADVVNNIFTVSNHTEAINVNATFVNATPEPYAVMEEDSLGNLMLTFMYDTNKGDGDFAITTFANYGSREWDDISGEIKTVAFDESFKNYQPTSTAYWFYGMANLTDIQGIGNLNTSAVTSMTSMFERCSALITLDLSNFVTSQVSNMANMFAYCSALTTIYAGDGWSTESVQYSANMFIQCPNLVGSKGTTVTSTGADYARIDGGEAAPGYLSDPNAPTSYNVTVKAVGNGSVSVGSLTISGGSEEHITMPAGGNLKMFLSPATGYKIDNVKLDGVNKNDSIVPATATTAASYTLWKIYDSHTVTVTFANDTDEPYAVLDGNTLTFYYNKQKEERQGMSVGPFSISGERGWDSQKESITRVVFDESFANCTTITSTADWFVDMSSLATIEGIRYLNTQNVTEMWWMFGNCSSLTNLDLSSFNTQQVTDMYCMFSGCSGLASLNVSSFNTQNVTRMEGMFSNCSSLTTLDLSSFNTQNVGDMRNMFTDCSSLTTIYVGSSWTTAAVTDSYNMFSGCTALVGSKGTEYNNEYVDATYARIDGGAAAPGYLSDINAATEFDVLVKAVGNGSVSVGSLTISGGSEEHITMPAGGNLKMFLSPATGYKIDNVKLDGVNMNDSIVSATATTAASYTLWKIYDSHTITVTFVNDTDEPYAVLSDNDDVAQDEETGEAIFGKTLTFYYDTKKAERGGMSVGPFYSRANREWGNNITRVVFDSSFANDTTIISTAYWFSGMSYLIAIEELQYLNTQNVTDMSDMFYHCRSLTSLDVTGFNTQNVTNLVSMFEECRGLMSLDLTSFNTQNVTDMSEMFAYCNGLTTIYVGSKWSTANVTDSRQMFEFCTSLVGGRGTTYNTNYTDVTYACIDMAPDAPGYFTRTVMMGDANDDGSITIADAVATVTNILGEATDEYFSQSKADMNNDSEIDIFDVTLIVNAVLAASPAPAYNGGNIAAEDVRLESQANSLAMGIDGSAPYTAFQFDVTLPEGTTLEGVRLANKATNHQLAFQKVGENTYRVVGLSMTNQQLSAANGRLVQLQLSGNADESNVKMSNVLFVGQPATDATAIRNHVTDGAADNGAIYDLNGRYVGNDRRQLSKGIYIINHKKVNIK